MPKKKKKNNPVETKSLMEKETDSQKYSSSPKASEFKEEVGQDKER